MVRTKARSPAAYLRTLPPERRRTIAAVRAVIRKNLPAGYVETINWGMLCYEIPLEKYPNTYNGQPLGCVALASQKNYCSLYLTCVYRGRKQDAILKAGFRAAGKKLNTGKSCIRFQRVEDLPLPVIAKLVRAVPPRELIRCYEASR